MYFPFAACLALGHARLALVEQIECVSDGVADFAFGRAGDAVTGVERGVDGGFESGSGHRDSLGESILEWQFREAFSGFAGGESRRPPCHHPRKRVIQYSRDGRTSVERPRRAGCPAFAGMTI